MRQFRAMNVIIKFPHICNAFKGSITNDMTIHECIEMKSPVFMNSVGMYTNHISILYITFLLIFSLPFNKNQILTLLYFYVFFNYISPLDPKYLVTIKHPRMKQINYLFKKSASLLRDRLFERRISSLNPLKINVYLPYS